MDSPMPPSPVESERRGGDRVTTDTRFFVATCHPPPRSNPCCRRCTSTGGYPLGTKTPTTGS